MFCANSYELDPPDKLSVVSNLPPMVVFPNFSDFYETWRQDLVSRGVNVRLSTEMTRVISRDNNGVRVAIKKRTPVEDHHNPNEGEIYQRDMSQQETEEHYDEIVFCCLADTNKRLLGSTATWREKQVLGSCKFSDDITVTHNDSDYMKRHYQNFYDEKLAVTTLSGVDQTTRCEMGKHDFKPMCKDPENIFPVMLLFFGEL